MISRAWLFGMLLVVPVIGFGVAEGLRTHFDSELRSVLRTEFPDATEGQLAQVTMDTLCEEAATDFGDLCLTNSNLRLMSGAALGAGMVGLILLLLIRIAGRLARRNRNLLVALFRPGLYLTALVLIALVLVHAAVAMGAIWYGESALVGRVHVGIIAAIGLGALAGVAAITRSTFSLVHKAETFVVGERLGRDDAVELWNAIEATARRLDALQPDNVVVGLDPNFFVTEADVVCLQGKLTGRTLYCSLPLARILSTDELTAVIGHELAHFKGEDTKFSEKFYPVYRGTASSLAALHAAGGENSGSLALLPAVAVFSYFLECFSVAESALSREREFLADEVAAGVTSSRNIASALVKLHAFGGVWHELQQGAADALAEGKVFVNVSRTYAEVVRERANADALEGLAGVTLNHPTDSHPPLAKRLESLQVHLTDIATDALAVTPSTAGIHWIPEAERLEEEISGAFQMLLARQLGIAAGDQTHEAESTRATDSPSG